MHMLTHRCCRPVRCCRARVRAGMPARPIWLVPNPSLLSPVSCCRAGARAAAPSDSSSFQSKFLRARRIVYVCFSNQQG